jgi:hypothetical protein
MLSGMVSSRILVLGILASFIVGVGVGHFLADTPASPTPGQRTSLSGTGGDQGGQPGFAGGADPSAANAANSANGADDGLPAGDSALVQKFWGCLIMPDETERQLAWLAMLGKLTKEDAEGVRELFNKMDRQGRHFLPEWETFLGRWGRIDGVGAMAYLERHPEEQARPNLAERILRGWGQADPEAAAAWLGANPELPNRANALRGFVDGFAKRDLDRATQFVMKEAAENPEELAKLMDGLSERALQQRQLGGLAKWFEQMPDSPAKRSAFEAVNQRLQRASDGRAADWVAEQAGQPWRSDKAIAEAAAKIAKSDPRGAVDWASKLPASPTTGRVAGLHQAVTALATQDAAAAQAWLEQSNLPAAVREEGRAAYTFHLLSVGDPEGTRWLESLPDKALLAPGGKRGGSGRIQIGGEWIMYGVGVGAK